MGRSKNLTPEEQVARLVDGAINMVERAANSPHGRSQAGMQEAVAEGQALAADVRRQLGVDD